MTTGNPVDAQNPWLGLTSFGEDTRQYFHGREEEGAELARRVQRRLLTVLFGQSGLGKTSLLQAGLVPRLRQEGFCPVYVRLDYHPDAPSPAEQIKRAVILATQAAGTWTKAGSAVSGESLWEFLHHRDDVLHDATGRTLTPIMIFDQFEEIFTLAQADEAGRRRAREFLADLADLVENRPPTALEARIDRDEVDAAQFDFARADYRIVISLREDYLANLEALKGEMPSVTQNRMRLARMTGPQAIAAVRGPAPALVSEPVAAAIVRFVSGGTDGAAAEVEPSLLSLICRELNNARVARGQAEISADLLAGSRDTILQEFYERAVGDQAPGVRAFIEDELLTDSGYRENVAVERARKSLAAAGADPAALDTLVNRRLLRVEERLDVRRVELMHDVLCGVVKASRDVRRERDATLAVERQLAATRAQEEATRRSLVRARLVAAVAVVLMLVAAGSAGFGFVNLRRARAADAQARQSQRLAEGARSQSEKLVSFLLEDFYDELASTGRLDVVGKLADQAVAYYDALPAELRTRQSEIYRGMALSRQAEVLATEGKIDDGTAASRRARDIFEPRLAAGDRADDVAVGEAFALFSTTTVGEMRDDAERLERAVALLRPIVNSGRASRSARLAFADMLQFLAHSQPSVEKAVALAEEARRVLDNMGALTLRDLSAASIYADVTDSESRFETRRGRIERARTLSRQVADLAERVLQQRPDDLRAMKDAYFAADEQARIAKAEHNWATAERLDRQAVATARYYLRFNPADIGAWDNLAAALMAEAQSTLELGRIAEGRQRLIEATASSRDPLNRAGVTLFEYLARQEMVSLDARDGRLDAARADIAQAREDWETFARLRGVSDEMKALGRAAGGALECEVMAARGDYRSIAVRAAEVQQQIQRVPHVSESATDLRNFMLNGVGIWRCEAALRLGQFSLAESIARQQLEHPLFTRFRDRSEIDAAAAQSRVQLGQALTGLQRKAEARAVLDTADAYYRAQWQAGARGTSFRLAYARALLQEGRAQEADGAGRSRRTALLAQAADVAGGLSTEAQALRQARELAASLRVAQAGEVALLHPATAAVP